MTRPILALLLNTLLVAFTASAASADVEMVHVGKVDQNVAVVVRGDATVLTIVTTTGCLSLNEYERKRVLIVTPNGSISKRSFIMLPGNERCGLEGVKNTGVYQKVPGMPKQGEAGWRSMETVMAVELALDMIGFSPGDIDGVYDDDTRSAVTMMQQQWALEESGLPNAATIVAMVRDFIDAYPKDEIVYTIAMDLFMTAKMSLARIGECERGLEMTAISERGDQITLNDGSVWKVEKLDFRLARTFKTGDGMTACQSVLKNQRNGQILIATKVR